MALSSFFVRNLINHGSACRGAVVPFLQRFKHISAVKGNEAAAYVGFAMSDLAIGYPITPSSEAFEITDVWNSQGKKNVFGDVPSVSVMQSEGGVAGALHGALSTGALATTFTSSQGLMLMIPNLYKMALAGLPGVIHVSSRSMIRQIGTMFCDHSDVMTCRTTGFAMMSSSSVQEIHDLGLASHIAALKASVPFLHFFDGFRTSHEISKIEQLSLDEMRSIIPHEKIREFRKGGFNPEHPSIRGAPVNQDTAMQWMESANGRFEMTPSLVESALKDVEKVTGRHYELFDYKGHPEAENVMILMGSASQTAQQVADFVNKNKKGKYGVITVHLYRPFSAEHLMKAIPKSAKVITVMDRTREYGSFGEPLYQDVATVLKAHDDPRPVINGVYGLCGKDPLPEDIYAAFKNSDSAKPKRRFTVGIVDDVTNRSIAPVKLPEVLPEGTKQCVFWGLGADGTVGANQEAIAMISNNTNLFAQGYFVYEAKKSGGWTFSHLRFGPKPIKASYEIQSADYVACHNPTFLAKYPVIDRIKENGVFMLNSSCKTAEDFEKFVPDHVKRVIAERNVKFYNVDAYQLAKDIGMRANHINMIMQSCFFKLADVIDIEEAKKMLKKSVVKKFGKLGGNTVKFNTEAIDRSLENLREVKYPRDKWLNAPDTKPDRFAKFTDAPKLVKDLIFPSMNMEGASLPVSAFLPVSDGRLPLGTSKYEKRGAALGVPVWNSEKCVQCNECSMKCPHGTIRPFLVTKEEAEKGKLKTAKAKGKSLKGKDLLYSLNVSPLDCLGCGVCANECPETALKMTPIGELDMEFESKKWDYLVGLPNRAEEAKESPATLKSLQFREPLLEYNGACEGCGETPYVKLMTQMFGDRLYIANATGCGLIWGAHFPVSAYTTNRDGHGPSWGNSLFEDNAEYGYGMVQATSHKIDKVSTITNALVKEGKHPQLAELCMSWQKVKNDPLKSKEAGKLIKRYLAEHPSEVASSPLVRDLDNLSDQLTKPSHWIIGGDGWAYDIGYGGLDHVLAQRSDINALVMDNESYANTGFQKSKSTPHGATAKFASAGNTGSKKELGLMMMQYNHIYVASVAMGANPRHTIRAFAEADAYPGPSIIIAYSPCMGHKLSSMATSQEEMDLAVKTGYWPLYRYNPLLAKQGKNPFLLDSQPSQPIEEFYKKEQRYCEIFRKDPVVGTRLRNELKDEIDAKWVHLRNLAERK